MAEPRETDPRLEAAIDEALSDLAIAEPSHEFRGRVLEALDRQPGTARPGVWRPVLATAVAAAITVLAFLRPVGSPTGGPAPRHASVPRVGGRPLAPPPARAKDAPTGRDARAARPLPRAKAPTQPGPVAEAVELAAVEVPPITPPPPLVPPPPLAVPRVIAERVLVEPIDMERPADTFQKENR